jgi:FlaA1/EpsC-like NDP-sugar epimerase
MVELSGLRPGDIEIKFIGARPGEKIREELARPGENTSPTSHPRINMLRGALNLDSQRLNQSVQALVEIARSGNEYETRTRLMELTVAGAEHISQQALETTAVVSDSI